jgi:hypothetical protein
MKSVLPIVSILALAALLAFRASTYVPQLATAEVAQKDGFYIFSDCKPVMPHDTLGTVELGFVSGTQYESIKNNLIKKGRQQYPTGNGLILQLNKRGLDKAVVIRFGE